MTENELIKEYKKTKAPELKLCLVEKYLPLIKFVAYRMQPVYENYAEAEDIINEGVIIILNLLDRFDTEKNVKFETFAQPRLRGGIIDFVREQDFAPRRVIKNIKAVETAKTELTAKLARLPTDTETAKHMGLTRDQIAKFTGEAHNTSVLSLEMVIYGASFQTDYEDFGDTPEQQLQKSELIAAVRNAVAKLSRRERYIIYLNFKQNLSSKEIAAALGVSAPRVSQLKSTALKKIRKNLINYI